MSQPFIGPLPYPHLPEQPAFPTWCTTWTSYDVPRIWDIVRVENDGLGWAQVLGFRQLSDLLVDQYRRLRTQRNNLADAWRAPAADVYLSRLDSFSLGLLSDAHCAATTASALDGIMTTYADARMKIGVLSEHWDRVTTDVVPEWWDKAAADLNTQAAKIMYQTDEAVRDHRTRIIIPETPMATKDTAPVEPGGTNASSQFGTTRVPPIPGYLPVDLSSERSAQPASGDGASLAGMPQPVPSLPGQPVSMLPIPPSGGLLPYGGAYVLPGPGVGQRGYIVPMPTPRDVATPFAPGSSGTSPRGTTPPGAVPLSVPASAGERSPNRQLYRRRTEVWHVREGVPPVIKPIDQDVATPNQPGHEQDQAFKEWFADLAYPWRASENANQPHVILRKVSP